MSNNESRPAWLTDLCKNKAPGIILIDGDGEKAQCLDFAHEIGAMMLENGVAERLCVWSWQAFLWLHGRYLMGDSSTDVHCWTIKKDVGMWSRAFHLGSSDAEAPSSNRACRFPAHGFPCETGVIGISFS